ncbi:CIC11C00000001331 [Sungouiella intermedia]|uniref:CIC11C00000001331 n=1 Tax=Sungouiella intermedia TaxID=45354 RepID=A0A1L0BDK3_9ASCO|nr:CIC11C00000001331 [[Candida] intermedia]
MKRKNTTSDPIKMVPPMEPTKPPINLAFLSDPPELLLLLPDRAAVGTVINVVMVVSGKTLIVDTIWSIDDVDGSLVMMADVEEVSSLEVVEVEELEEEVVDDGIDEDDDELLDEVSVDDSSEVVSISDSVLGVSVDSRVSKKDDEEVNDDDVSEEEGTSEDESSEDDSVEDVLEKSDEVSEIRDDSSDDGASSDDDEDDDEDDGKDDDED